MEIDKVVVDAAVINSKWQQYNKREDSNYSEKQSLKVREMVFGSFFFGRDVTTLHT